MRQIVIALIGTLMLTLFMAGANASGATKLPGPLVNTDWLSENLNKVVILDVRKDLDSFLKEGHIEGAILVNSRKVRVKRKQGGYELSGMMPDRKHYEQFMSAHGVGTNSIVVITMRGKTPGHSAGAARLYWHMKYYGFKRVALLDGGNQAWVDALGDLTNKATAVKSKKFTAGKVHRATLATMQDVEQSLTDKNTVLVDTRNLRFHIGLEKRSYVKDYGHIPDSLLLPYKFLYPTKGAAKFYSTDIIKQVLNALHIDAKQNLILYCNSAFECSSVWFALHELVGLRNIRIYDGSLNEWTMDGRHPMTREATIH